MMHVHDETIIFQSNKFYPPKHIMVMIIKLRLQKYHEHYWHRKQRIALNEEVRQSNKP